MTFFHRLDFESQNEVLDNKDVAIDMMVCNDKISDESTDSKEQSEFQEIIPNKENTSKQGKIEVKQVQDNIQEYMVNDEEYEVEGIYKYEDEDTDPSIFKETDIQSDKNINTDHLPNSQYGQVHNVSENDEKEVSKAGKSNVNMKNIESDYGNDKEDSGNPSDNVMEYPSGDEKNTSKESNGDKGKYEYEMKSRVFCKKCMHICTRILM